MNHPAKYLRQGRELFKSDSLFRNAAYLMSSTAIMSVLGFGFWIFVAHLYTAADIGVASALISITLLISNLSFFGLNAGLIRFLPGSKDRSRDINATMITVGTAAMVAGAVYVLLFSHNFIGELSIFSTSLAGRGAFALLMAAVCLNTFTDSVFIASRRAEFHTIVYAVFGAVKMLVPLILIPLGSLGIFLAYIAAVVASLVLSLFFMWRGCGYRPLARPNWGFIVKSRKYAANNYVAVLLSGLPAQAMPTLIISRLGGASAAYFSMAWTMANLLYVIPSAMTNSLLAESSHDISKQAKNVRHAVRMLAIILIPAVAVAIVAAPYLLRLFGAQYATGGTRIFQLFALSTFFIAAINIGSTILNLDQRSKSVVLVEVAITSVTLGLAALLLRFGLTGVGLAMLGGNVAGMLVTFGLLARNRTKQPPTSSLGRGDVKASGPAMVRQLLTQLWLRVS